MPNSPDTVAVAVVVATNRCGRLVPSRCDAIGQRSVSTAEEDRSHCSGRERYTLCLFCLTRAKGVLGGD
jgi:hypothetical protein